jgi:hypothetical protein
MKPPVWFSLILAIQELSCLLFCSSLYYYAKYTNFKNIIRCHSTGLILSKPGTFSPDRRLSRPNPDPQGPTCLTRVLPTCPTSFDPLDFNLWIDVLWQFNVLWCFITFCFKKQYIKVVCAILYDGKWRLWCSSTFDNVALWRFLTVYKVYRRFKEVLTDDLKDVLQCCDWFSFRLLVNIRF